MLHAFARQRLAESRRLAAVEDNELEVAHHRSERHCVDQFEAVFHSTFFLNPFNPRESLAIAELCVGVAGKVHASMTCELLLQPLGARLFDPLRSTAGEPFNRSTFGRHGRKRVSWHLRTSEDAHLQCRARTKVVHRRYCRGLIIR